MNNYENFYRHCMGFVVFAVLELRILDCYVQVSSELFLNYDKYVYRLLTQGKRFSYNF